MSKILALDFGDAKTGVAVADTSFNMAFAREAIKTDKNILVEILNFCKSENIDEIVIGLPLNLNNTESDRTHKTKSFALKLSDFLNNNFDQKIKVHLFDERLSTFEAERKLKETGIKGASKENDSVAALNFLQSYLEKRR